MDLRLQLRSFRAAGLLIIPAAGSNLTSEILAISPGAQPTVCLDRCPKGWQGDAVTVANELGSYQATKYLIDCGHRHIAVITGPAQLANAVERLNGFKRALHEAHLALPPEFIQEAEFNTRSGFRVAKRLLRMLPRPTAVFACNDLMALGVLHAVHDLGLRCPEDVSLFGFDNLEFCEYTSPALSSVFQPGYQLGATAARLLLDRINGLSQKPKRILLETELKIRSSVAAIGPVRKSARDPEGVLRTSAKR
ncbi:MAG: substrate-binding domain-containing protein [Candidatus Acidiferrum sp.]